jgi:DNA-binding transcriptional MerR regulator
VEKLFTQGEVNRIFKHIPSSTLLYWGKVKVISWSGESHDGRGLHRLYSREDLYTLGLVEELTALNFPLDIIRKSVTEEYFRKPRVEGKVPFFTWRRTLTPPKDLPPEYRESYLVLSRGRSGRKDTVSSISLGLGVQLMWQEDIEKKFSIPGEDVEPVITNVIIRLSQVINKVDIYISEAE